MPVLTPKEILILCSDKPIGTENEKKVAIDKLNAFQADKTSKIHIAMVNSLIPEAEKFVTKEMSIAASQKAFIGAMNQLARAAGLRC